jgi:hypothetical protein
MWSRQGAAAVVLNSQVVLNCYLEWLTSFVKILVVNGDRCGALGQT